MTYARYPYGGVGYAGSDVASIPTTDTQTTLAVEWSPTTGALAEPVWVDITGDVRSWNTSRGRNRELERYQPGRATIVLSNLDRQYDSVYTAGPNYGNIRPMRRIRIRETFNGVTYPVFDGFVDRWQLEYPNSGRDATATVTATDLMKVLARTDVGRSVYTNVVKADLPILWWRLDETLGLLKAGSALNAGTTGPTMNGTFVGQPRIGGPTLVVNDPGSSLQTADSFAAPGTPIQGVTIPNAALDLWAKTTLSAEAWIRLGEGGTTTGVIWAVCLAANADMQVVCGYLDAPALGTDGQIIFAAYNSAFLLTYGVMTATGSIRPSQTHHVVAVVEADGQMVIYLDGVRVTTTLTGAAASSLSGVTRPTGGHLTFAHEDEASNPLTNWQGELDEFAVYDYALTQAQVTAHYEAGTTPWGGDLPGVRAGRVLDVAAIPATLREVDAGITTFQPATTTGQSVLEHSQKIAETEFGLWFITRAGVARLVGRTGLFARLPATATYGDQAGQVGYRNFVPDDGDEVIRNRAVISRLDGEPRTATDTASLAAYGPFEYVLDGLLHSSDSYSLDYANLIVDEYGIQQRRVASLTIGPPIAGQEAVVYPAMLGPELGDAITVSNTPVGGGTAFTQTCAVEGIMCAGAPGGDRTTTFILSPEFAA